MAYGSVSQSAIETATSACVFLSRIVHSKKKEMKAFALVCVSLCLALGMLKFVFICRRDEIF